MSSLGGTVPFVLSTSRFAAIAVTSLVATLLVGVGAGLPSAAAEPTGTVSGTVTGPDGLPLAAVTVVAHREIEGAWRPEQFVQISTDANGTYTATLPADTYRFCFVPPYTPAHADTATICSGGAAFPEDAADVGVGGAAVVVDAHLARGAQLVGTVVRTGGAPLAGQQVSLQRFDPQYGHWMGNGRNYASTGPAGEFTVRGVAPGTYRLCVDHYFLPGDLAATCWGGGPVAALGTDIVVEDGQDQDGFVVEIGPASSISGRLTVAGGGVVPAGYDLSPTAYVQDPDTGAWVVVRNVGVGDQGGYTIGGLAPGTYRVCFQSLPLDEALAEECWDDVGFVEEADDVTIGVSVQRGGIDATVMRWFADVSWQSTAFMEEIGWLAKTRVTTGYDLPGGRREFRPSAPVLREQMAAFLYRVADRMNGEAPIPVDTTGPSPFVDVPKSHPFYREILWLSRSGITTGYDLGNGLTAFRPAAPVLREQMAAFLYRFDGQDRLDRDGESFTDLRTDHVFFDEVEWLATTGITTGYVQPDGSRTFEGGSGVLREQMAAFLFRYDRLVQGR